MKNQAKTKSCRVVVNLNREEFEFIDKIGRDSLFTTGRRLTNNKILRTCLNIIRKSVKIKGDNLHNTKELQERIVAALGVNKERRLYSRFNKEVKVASRKIESLSDHEEGKTIDISPAGFRIRLKEQRNIGDVLEFIIQDLSENDVPVKAIGRIVWIKETEDTKEAGIKLTYISKNNIDRFNNLLKQKGAVS